MNSTCVTFAETSFFDLPLQKYCFDARAVYAFCFRTFIMDRIGMFKDTCIKQGVL